MFPSNLSIFPVLSYADDAVILAEDVRSMRQGLDTLAEWCSESAVEINVEKCGVMYVRRKGVKRTEEKFYVGGDEVKVVEEYKWLPSFPASPHFCPIH